MPLLLAFAANAQFSSLVVDSTATRVWFTSKSQLRGDESPRLPRIYETGPAGTQLFLDPENPNTVDAPSMLSVSDDNDVFAWVIYRWGPAPSGTAAVKPMIGSWPPVHATYFVRRQSDGAAWSFPQSIAVSRNGRWLWALTQAIDLRTGTTYDVAPWTRVSKGVSDEGDAMVRSRTGEYGMLRPGGSVRPLGFPIEPNDTGFWIDRHATTVVWVAASGTTLRKGEVSTGMSTDICTSCSYCSQVAVSPDGRRVLFARDLLGLIPGVWVADTWTGEYTILADGRPASAAFSATGEAVCYNATDGTLNCTDLTTGDTRVLIGRTTSVNDWCNSNDHFAVPGNRCAIAGSGLLDASVTVNGVPAKVQASTDTLLVLIIPKETEPGTASFVFDQPSSPFVSIIDREARAFAGRAVNVDELADPTALAGYSYLENGTTGGLVTQFEPVHPGQDLWIHMAGLGRDPTAVMFHFMSLPSGPEQFIVPFEITDDDGWHTVKIHIPAKAPPVPALLHWWLGTQDGATLQIPISEP